MACSAVRRWAVTCGSSCCASAATATPRLRSSRGVWSISTLEIDSRRAAGRSGRRTVCRSRGAWTGVGTSRKRWIGWPSRARKCATSSANAFAAKPHSRPSSRTPTIVTTHRSQPPGQRRAESRDKGGSVNTKNARRGGGRQAELRVAGAERRAGGDLPQRHRRVRARASEAAHELQAGAVEGGNDVAGAGGAGDAAPAFAPEAQQIVMVAESQPRGDGGEVHARIEAGARVRFTGARIARIVAGGGDDAEGDS